MSRRTERVASLIRSIIAETIQNRLSDPRIAPITSITRIEVSDDLSVARVFVSVMASESKRKLCLAALRSAAGLLRRRLGPELRLRKIPVLDFRLDESLQQGFETVEAIDEVMRELGEGPEWERGEVGRCEREDVRTCEREDDPSETRMQAGDGRSRIPTSLPSHDREEA